jgi:hypothetical protein
MKSGNNQEQGYKTLVLRQREQHQELFYFSQWSRVNPAQNHSTIARHRVVNLISASSNPGAAWSSIRHREGWQIVLG